MWSFKDHGKSWEQTRRDDHPAGFRWVHESFGSNFRMLEVQAAIGRVQLRRLGDWSERRRANADALAGALRNFPDAVRVPQPGNGMVHAYYRLYAYVRPNGLRDGWSRDRIVAEISGRGVPAFHGSCPEVYLEKAFDGTSFRPAERLPAARELGETSIAFLTHPTLAPDDVNRACAAIDDVFARASR